VRGPLPVSAIALSIDAVTAEHLERRVRNAGVLAGWTGDTLVLEGEARAAAGVVTVRETIIRLGDSAGSRAAGRSIEFNPSEEITSPAR
jgi:hypothetical protein